MRIVTAAIIFSRGRVLIARRRSGSSEEGLWEFPGGSLEAGETLQDCLKRELAEELGIETEVGDAVAESSHCDDHGAFRLIALVTRIISGVPTPVAHDEIAWVKIRDLGRYRLAPADVVIAAAIRKRKDLREE
jgi:mutator protein MutT